MSINQAAILSLENNLYFLAGRTSKDSDMCSFPGPRSRHRTQVSALGLARSLLNFLWLAPGQTPLAAKQFSECFRTTEFQSLTFIELDLS